LAVLRTVFVVLCLGVVLAGCQDPRSSTVRYRVIATVEVDGKPVEKSTVMEIKYRTFDNQDVNWFIAAVTGMSRTLTSTQQYGEALIIDLGDRGMAFLLPRTYTPYGPGTGSFTSGIYDTSLLLTFGITNKLFRLDENDHARLRNVKGRFPLKTRHPDVHPAMTALSDEKNPETLFQVDPHNMEASFSGVRLVGIDIEITNDPVTSKLPQRLPWLMGRKGKAANDHSTPVIYPLKTGDRFVRAIQEQDFFANQSY
jgi:hypothetical protein